MTTDSMTEPSSETAATQPIYLDYQATTPTDPRVVEAMLPFFYERFGNPHSVQHALGWDAEAAVEKARAQVAALIGAEPREIVFTSGATEANNMAIKGAARFHAGHAQGDRKRRVVTTQTEHKCVLESCRRLEREGFEVIYLPVESNGLLDLDRLTAAVTEETAIVSVMAVNNEIGVIQPLAEIGAICHAKGAYFHSDAAQAIAKIPIDVQAMSIDLLSISAHKMYGPKGIGVLYVRRRPRVRLEPLFDGGGQERGFRSGTLPAPLCVGLGEACAIASRELDEETARLERLKDKLLAGLTSRLEGVAVNGDPERRIPGNLNLSFAGIDSEALMEAMPGLAVSTGSACTSASVEPSYVLRGIGLPDELARASLRIGLGRFTSEDEIDRAIEQIVDAVTRLRGADPAAASTAAE